MNALVTAGTAAIPELPQPHLDYVSPIECELRSQAAALAA
jgi:hypothetical protein